MWIVHKLNTMIDECRAEENVLNFGMIDEAAAFWEASGLYAMAEELGPKFGHTQVDGMTFLNRQIVNRFINIRDLVTTPRIRATTQRCTICVFSPKRQWRT